jgi:hypothetical protein
VSDVVLIHKGSVVNIEYADGLKASNAFGFPEAADHFARGCFTFPRIRKIVRVTVTTTTTYVEDNE